mgnify:FL=1
MSFFNKEEEPRDKGIVPCMRLNDINNVALDEKEAYRELAKPTGLSGEDISVCFKTHHYMWNSRN